MNPSDFAAYSCPSCQSPLEPREPRSPAAVLACPGCDLRFPIVRGIPRFVPAENYAGSFGYQWNVHRRTQLDSYTGLPISADRLFSVTGWPRSMQGQVILEAGSGAGRFTEVLLATGAEVYSFDLSSAVDANYANNGRLRNLHLFQASIDRIPFPKRHFDKVMCLGVLQHTPDPEKSFSHLVEMVRPGGEIVIDIYALDALALLQWKYVLRPITKRMNGERLYRTIERAVPLLLPTARVLGKLLGRAGRRVMPIVEYSHLGLTPELNRQWAVLDTFDMYAPAHDHPRSLREVERWFAAAGLAEVTVRRGPNGVVAKGRRPAIAS
jgi:SAM-dependent methyltransferase